MYILRACDFDSRGFCTIVFSGINRISDKNDYAFFMFITVAERDGTFHAGKNSHNHTAEFEAAIARKIVNTDKTKALDNKFKPASAIVNEVITMLH